MAAEAASDAGSAAVLQLPRYPERIQTLPPDLLKAPDNFAQGRPGEFLLTPEQRAILLAALPLDVGLSRVIDVPEAVAGANKTTLLPQDMLGPGKGRGPLPMVPAVARQSFVLPKKPAPSAVDTISSRRGKRQTKAPVKFVPQGAAAAAAPRVPPRPKRRQGASTSAATNEVEEEKQRLQARLQELEGLSTKKSGPSQATAAGTRKAKAAPAPKKAPAPVPAKAVEEAASEGDEPDAAEAETSASDSKDQRPPPPAGRRGKAKGRPKAKAAEKRPPPPQKPPRSSAKAEAKQSGERAARGAARKAAAVAEEDAEAGFEQPDEAPATQRAGKRRKKGGDAEEAKPREPAPPPQPKQLAFLTPTERESLQATIDQLPDEHLDQVIEWLEGTVKPAEQSGEDMTLDLDELTPQQQWDLVKLVDQLVKGDKAAAKPSVPAATASPAFPVAEPGATPLAQPSPATKDVAPATPKSEMIRVWEESSARALQRKSHLQEARESRAASTPGGGTPRSVVAEGAGGLGAVPDLQLPEAAIPAGAFAPAAVAAAKALENEKSSGYKVAAPVMQAKLQTPREAQAQPEAPAQQPERPSANNSGDSMLEFTDDLVNL
eukprot:TRINITY_DN110876_c0_g1_i1.p1 TRINITY_DN110876_c0_g1~~TRINITY_DN110876_c0_g1_i1.p1  ORF type:complete len:605 (-),score=218.79 TRINITY_DN110876_c0_g1_i1:110-1924(-)